MKLAMATLLIALAGCDVPAGSVPDTSVAWVVELHPTDTVCAASDAYVERFAELPDGTIAAPPGVHVTLLRPYPDQTVVFVRIVDEDVGHQGTALLSFGGWVTTANGEQLEAWHGLTASIALVGGFSGLPVNSCVAQVSVAGSRGVK